MRYKAIFVLLTLTIALSAALAGPPAFGSAITDERFDTREEIAEWLKGKRVGRYVGATTTEELASLLAGSEEVWVNSFADMTAGVYANKIDCFLCEEPIARQMCRVTEGLYTPGTYLLEENYAFALKLGNDELAGQLNATILRLRADGTLDRLREKWTDGDASETKMPDIALTGENGLLRVATDAEDAPFGYVANGEMVGYDYELLTLFAEEHGYALEYRQTSWDALPAAVVSGKCDIACGCLTVTKEHEEQLLMSEVTLYSGVTLVMADRYAPEYAQDGARGGLGAACSSVLASFERTFIRESRWKMIARGLWTTLEISVLSAILGTALGFGVCAMRMSRCRFPRRAANVFIQAMQGTPVVVLLMILYYVVFGDVNPMLVAVVGFALYFAAYVSEMMRVGIEAVDKGQIEAASAIGFTRTRAFWLITFPQAARHFLPVFRGEFISLVKMTSVVGYISIVDLAKTGDLIRSRTYEAFFPLIATAVIYFLLSWTLTRGLSVVELRVDPKRRRRAVKGVREEETAK